MTWVKICGITNLEDAETAVEAGADALGFVFYEKSPRKIDPETAREIVAKLPASVERVGVFAGDAPERWAQIARECQLTAVQLAMFFCAGDSHTPNAASHAAGIATDTKVYIALPATVVAGGQMRLDFPESFGTMVDAIFVDSGSVQQPGGTGKAFDWAKAAPAVETMKTSVKVVVAGGLTPANVAEAMRILRPWGVDVSSGVEARPGKKDPEKVRAFIAAVREADKVH